MSHRFAIVLLIGLISLSSALKAQEKSDAKSDLKILLVTHDPDAPRVAFADQKNKRTLAFYSERKAAFDKFLNQRFRNVTIVHGADYIVAMSDKVEVTIFDCRPKTLTAAKREVNEKTGKMDYQAATYLPASFDRAALMISENSPFIGEPLGLKLDWL